MLSPYTQVGTKVVCINAQGAEGYLLEGQVYTVKEVYAPRLSVWTVGNQECVGVIHGVELEEVGCPTNDGFHPRRFRPAVLPKCLTDLLIPEMV